MQVFFNYLIIILVATIIFVPLFKRLGLGAVVGYLIAGYFIGPYGLALIAEVESIMHLSEFGIVLLLFLIGLELSLSRLWQMRHSIFTLGALQVGLGALIFVLILWPFLPTLNKSVVISLGLVLSSTPMALQLINERGMHQSPAGRQAFSLLLFQDLAIIPILAILPLLSPIQIEAGVKDNWYEFALIIGAIAGMVFAGRFLLRPLFRIIAGTGLREIFTAFSLLIVFGVALMMHKLGLSMGLGAFLAGVLLSESEYKHAIEVDIEPFKGLLLGVFFISIGMALDFDLISSNLELILALTLAALLIKIALFLLIAKLGRIEKNQSLIFSLVLCQIGEFAFVIFNLAHIQNILDKRELGIASSIVALGMVINPILIIIYENWQRLTQKFAPKKYDSVDDKGPHIIIAGFGRMGQIVGRVLNAYNIPIAVLESNPTQIDLVRKFGYKVFYGDATRLDLLEQAGLRRAKALVIAVDKHESVLKIIHIVKTITPNLPIIARASSRGSAFDLIDLGIHHPVRETFHSALILAVQTLEQCGFSKSEAEAIVKKFQERDEAHVLQAAELRREGGEKALIAFAAEIRNQLATAMQEDEGLKPLIAENKSH
ncbi:MAG: cation:proton antiporter [Oligoflexales bacterium]|nr:cation:proton antiporter [Oligoflexales bacterium]